MLTTSHYHNMSAKDAKVERECARLERQTPAHHIIKPLPPRVKVTR